MWQASLLQVTANCGCRAPKVSRPSKCFWAPRKDNNVLCTWYIDLWCRWWNKVDLVVECPHSASCCKPPQCCKHTAGLLEPSSQFAPVSIACESQEQQLYDAAVKHYFLAHLCCTTKLPPLTSLIYDIMLKFSEVYGTSMDITGEAEVTMCKLMSLYINADIH